MQQDAVYYQVTAFVVTVLLGLFIGVAYDFFRVLRQLLRPSRRSLFFWDLFFWLCITPVVFAALLASNWGEVRAYVLIGLGLGGIIYTFFLTKTVYRLIDSTFRLVIKICRIAAAPIIRPTRWLATTICRGKKSLTIGIAKKNKALRMKIKEKIDKKRRN